MEAKVYTPQLFYEHYKKELLNKEAIYQLLINNCLRAIDDPQIDCLIGAIEEDGKAYLFFQQTFPYHMLAYGVDEVNEQMIETLLDFIKDQNIIFNGINSTPNIVQLVLKLGNIKEYQTRTKMGIMELKKNDLIEPIAIGKLIEGTKEDIELALDWYVLFYQECFNEAHDKEEYRLRMEKLMKDKDFFFYEVEKEKVAMCSISRRLINGAAVSLVFTPVQKRGKGYCKQMMSELSKVIFARGYSFSCLFVDTQNPISNKAYKAIGYQIIEHKEDIGFTI